MPPNRTADSSPDPVAFNELETRKRGTGKNLKSGATRGEATKKNGKGAGKPTTRKQPSKNLLMKQRNQARDEAKDRNVQVENLRTKNQELENHIRTLQNTCFELTDKMEAKYPRLDDREIQNRIYDIRRECQDWVKEYSIPGPFTPVSEGNVQELLRYPLENDEAAASFLKQFQHGTYLMLHKVLSLFICTKIFNHPLVCFRKPSEALDYLDRIFLDAQEKGVEMVREWIGDTIDIAERAALEIQFDCPEIPPKDAECSICVLTRGFLRNRPHDLLKELDKPCRNRRLEKLSKIMHQAGKLTLTLWRQRTGLECHYDAGKLTTDDFAVDPTLVVSHDIMISAANGAVTREKGIALVVEPAIVTHSFDGRFKVWAKATIVTDDCIQVTSSQQTPEVVKKEVIDIEDKEVKQEAVDVNDDKTTRSVGLIEPGSSVSMAQTIDRDREVRKRRSVPKEDGTSDNDQHSQDMDHSMSGLAKRKATMPLPLSNHGYDLRPKRQKQQQDVENPQSGAKVERCHRQSCGVRAVVPTISEPRLEPQRRQVVEISEGQNGNNTMSDDASADVSKMIPSESATIITNVPEHVASEPPSPKVDQKGAGVDDAAMEVEYDPSHQHGTIVLSATQHSPGQLESVTINTDVPEHVAFETPSPKVEQKGADADDTAMEVGNDPCHQNGTTVPPAPQHSPKQLEDITKISQGLEIGGLGPGPRSLLLPCPFRVYERQGDFDKKVRTWLKKEPNKPDRSEMI